MKNLRNLPGLLPLLAFGLILSFATGCSHENDRVIPNVAPYVEITGGPASGERQSYTSRIYWRGWDEDGVITHYEYAVDPPPEAFSLEEIANYQDYPEITSRLVPGPSEYEDTVRVSKTVEGTVYTFDWVETLEFSRSFAFETPDPDSVIDGSSQVPTDVYSGIHTIYVRAQDDDEAYSTMDQLSYTAETLVPESEIARPTISGDFLNIGATVTVAWDGTDADSPDPRKKPVGYLYRLLDLRSLSPNVPIYAATAGLLYRDEGMDSVWTYQSADTLQKTFFLKVPGSYIFGVRAVDVAGATEPFLEMGRNVFKFQTLSSNGSPELTLIEPSLGTNTYKGIAAPYEVEVPVGADLHFTWSASAESYGGTIEGYSWGIDIPDLDREGPDSGWSGWGKITSAPTITFERAGIHVLYVRARDLSGTITLGTLILDVLDFPLDREVLWVDDTRDQTRPRDSEHDAFWDNLFRDSGRFAEGEVDKLEIFGANDTYSRIPIPPTLAELGRYKLVIWECKGDGYNGDSGLWEVTFRKRHLGAYLSAGGKLWVGGTMTVAAMLPSAAAGADFVYPKEMAPNTFAWDFIKLFSGRIDNAKGENSADNLVGVKPFPGKTEIYPALDQDPMKINPFAGSIPFCDAVFDPMYAQEVTGFKGKLDSLYVYQTAKSNRTYHNKLNAVRWHDPDPLPIHGRTQWFGFPIYYMKKDQIQETFNRSIDWFREENGSGVTP